MGAPEACVSDTTIDQWGQLEQLRAEVARLRAGESDEPAAEGARLTPGEWLRAFNDACAAKRLVWAGRALELADAVGRCFLLDHGGAVEELRQAEAVLGRVRTLERALTVRAAAGDELAFLAGLFLGLLREALDGQSDQHQERLAITHGNDSSRKLPTGRDRDGEIV
jgi:hypothetical protein